MTVRALAAEVIADVLRGQSLDTPLERARTRLTKQNDRALLGALCFGAVRRGIAHRATVRALLSRPNQKLKPLVEGLIIVGLEQLGHMRIAPHAAVSETVAAARALKLKNATGLVNALLRRFQRERGRIDDLLAAREDTRVNHPAWLLSVLQQDWPLHHAAIIAGNNAPAPLWLRVNLLRGTRPDYLAALASGADRAAQVGDLVDAAVMLADPVAVSLLPGFDAGEVSVQDQSAQLAVALMTPPPAGARILDACAAPGGKTGHLCERFPECDVVAVDNNDNRLARVGENLQRLGHSATTACVDMTDADQVASLVETTGPFDRVLLDAPCTGSGVIRRHPDIKLLRRAGDSAKLAATQAALLEQAFTALQPGGELIYATCSVLRAENDGVVGAFIARTEAAQLAQIDGPDAVGHRTRCGRQRLPGEAGSDGFYYARIIRQAS